MIILKVDKHCLLILLLGSNLNSNMIILKVIQKRNS